MERGRNYKWPIRGCHTPTRCKKAINLIIVIIIILDMMINDDDDNDENDEYALNDLYQLAGNKRPIN